MKYPTCFLIKVSVFGLVLQMPGLFAHSQSTPIPTSPGRENVFNNHLWITFNHDSRFSERWSAHVEGHWRRAELGNSWQQLLLRPALNFHLNPNAILSVGYSFYRNYPYEERAFRYAFNEHHAYEQLQLAQPVGLFRFSHRLRFEQRFIETYNPDAEGNFTLKSSNRYLNRFRYRFMATLPLSKPTLEANTLFISAYDELFLTFGDDSRIDALQQNRISALLGWQLDNSGSSIQLGYLYQTIMFPREPIANPSGVGGLTDDLVENNRTIHLILTLNLDFRSGKAFVPWIPKGPRTIKTSDIRSRTD